MDAALSASPRAGEVCRGLAWTVSFTALRAHRIVLGANQHDARVATLHVAADRAREIAQRLRRA